jgi:hypothetical protein
LRRLATLFAVTSRQASSDIRTMTASTFASRALRFYTSLAMPPVPAGVDVMNPYADARARRYVRAFLGTFFADNNPRVLVLGINPGRFGAGITGVTFTDPVALADLCGIANELPRRRELSSVFIYDLIARLGGSRKFYQNFFLTAVSPLGFTRENRNLNYYDLPALARSATPFISAAIKRQIAIGGRTDHAIVLGLGENARFVRKLNTQHGFFGEIHAIEHPRWILQYRRRQLDRYLSKYEELFTRIASASSARKD